MKEMSLIDAMVYSGNEPLVKDLFTKIGWDLSVLESAFELFKMQDSSVVHYHDCEILDSMFVCEEAFEEELRARLVCAFRDLVKFEECKILKVRAI